MACHEASTHTKVPRFAPRGSLCLLLRQRHVIPSCGCTSFTGTQLHRSLAARGLLYHPSADLLDREEFQMGFRRDRKVMVVA